MELRSNIRGKTKIGYLVSADRSGRFVYARAGEVPIGVITQSVSRGELCEIQTTGEALVYVNNRIGADEPLRAPDIDEGVPAGVALPVGNKTSYRPVGQALENGKGLVRVSINLGATLSGGGGGLPPGGATGYVLTKQSAADGDADWEAVSGTGTVTSVSAGDGMDFTTITGSGAVTLGSPSTISATSLNARTATSHSHALDTSSLGFNVTVDGNAPSPNTISIGDDFDFLGDTTYIQIQWNQTNQRLEFSYVGPTDFYAGWDPDADSYVAGGPTRVGSAHTVNFNGSTYIDTTYLFTAGSPPTHDVNIELDTAALRGHLDSYYYDFATYPNLATQTWVTNNFDNYQSWNLQTGGVTREAITSGFDLDFIGDTTYIQVQYNATDDRMEFSYVGPTDFYAGWDPGADTGSPTRVGSEHEVNFIGSTYIDTAYNFTSGSPPTHDITISIDTTALDGRYYTQSALTTILADYALQSWVTNNFDNYQSWDLQTGGVSRENITSGFSLDFVGDTTYIQVIYNATEDRLEFSYVGPTDYYAGWDPGADSGSPTRVGSEHEVNFLGSTYINTAYNFTSGSPPTHDVTISIDTTALDGRYYTQTVADGLFATQTWVTNNFDDYDHWDFEYDTVTPQVKAINSGDSFGIVGGTDIGTSWDGVNNRLTINYAGSAGYTGWALEVEGTSRGSVGNSQVVDFKSGTYLTVSYNLNVSDHEVTYDIDQTAMDGRYYTITAANAEFYSRTYIDNNFDDYGGWDIWTGGVSRETISSGDKVDFVGGTDIQVTYAAADNEITIAYVGSASYTSWNFEILGTPHAIGDGGTAELIAGTGITIGYTLGGGGEHQATISLTGGTPVTSVTGGLGITSTGGTTPDIAFAPSELSVGGTLVAGDWLVADNGGAPNRQLISAIPLSIFNNDEGWTDNVGTVTLVGGGTGLSGTVSSSGNINLDLDSLPVGGTLVGTDHLAAANGTASQKQLISNIPLSIFNNDAGWTSNAGTITGVTGGVGITTAGSPSVTVTLAVNELSEKSGALVGTDRLVGTSGSTNFAETINQIPLSIFLNDEGWTAGGGSMNNWFINTDHTDSPKSIQEDAELYLIGGTGIDLTEVTFNTGDQRWELTISATSSSPWSTDTNGITYTAGNVGIGVASNSSYDLRVAGTVYFDSKLLVSGGGDNFQLYAGSTADHVYMEFFADSAAQTTRSGYFGFPSAGATQMILRNQMAGGTLQLQSEGEVIMQPGTSRVSRIRYGSSDRIVATSAGVEISGILDIERTGQSLSLKSGAASSSSYMGFYKGVLNDGTTADSTNTTRNAYFGYASGANNDFNLYNEIANSNTMIRGGSGTGSVRLYVGNTLMQYSLAAAHYWYIAGTAELALDSNTLYPNTNLGLSLGTSSKKWNNLYVNTIYASGEVESYDTSDIRLKKILAHLDVQDAIDGLMSLRTVRYEHKHKEGIRLGLIAQDVKQPFPENIKYDPDGHLMVHYGKMVVPLVTGFQNHEQRIQALEEELEELKKQRDTWRTL
jgi:hypothetical protein